MFFIDAASFIDMDDDSWRFFLIFEKVKRHLVQSIVKTKILEVSPGHLQHNFSVTVSVCWLLDGDKAI